MVKRVTLRTIAKLADCSTATVSTVLNGAHGNTKVGDALGENIMSIARRLKYCPNTVSRNLRLGRSRTLGVYVQPNLWHGLGYIYEMSIFHGIEEEALARGYDLLVLNISSQNLPDVCAQRLHEGRIDGVVLLHCSPGEWLDELLKTSQDVVALDFPESYEGLNVVSLDNVEGVRLGLSKLIEFGHRRIGWAGCVLENDDEDAMERLEAFRRLSREMGCDVDEDLFFDYWHCSEKIQRSEQYCQKGGRLAMRYFMKQSRPPTAVLCQNWLIEMAMCREAETNGWRVPQDLSLVGFDHYEMDELFSSPMTAIDHRLHDMGKLAVSGLIDRLENPAGDTPSFKLKIEPGFCPGTTIGPPRKGAPH